MLFLVGSTRIMPKTIAYVAYCRGFAGQVYPLYLTMLTSGAKPIETTVGMSTTKRCGIRCVKFEAER